MKLDWNNMEDVSLPHFYGGAKDMKAKAYFDKLNRISLATLEPGASIGVHVHEVTSEIVFILSGTGLATCSGVEERLKPGDCHYCPKGHSHSLENDGAEDLVFYTVVPQQ